MEDDHPCNPILHQRASEFLEIQRQIKTLGAQVAALRKQSKVVEQALVASFISSGVEEIQIEGILITRDKKIKCEL